LTKCGLGFCTLAGTYCPIAPPHLEKMSPALLLIRVAETRTGHTWRNLRHELDRMHLVTFATADGRVAQRSALTGDQKTILAALDLPEPPNT